MRSSREVEIAWTLAGHDPRPSDGPAYRPTAVGRPEFWPDNGIWATPNNRKERLNPVSNEDDAFMEYVFRMLQLRKLPLVELLAVDDVGRGHPALAGPSPV